MNAIHAPHSKQESMPLINKSERFNNQPVLSVKRKLWRKDDEHSALTEESFAKTRTEILARDDQTCRFCKFKVSKYQELHHLDGDHLNNDPSNLVTICNLCHQVFHLGMCAMQNGGFIAAIPELTQTEVNNIVRAIYTIDLLPKLPDRNNICNKLKSLYAIFEFRGSDTLKTLYGFDISSAFTFVDILANCPDKVYSERVNTFAPLRLVATRDAFKEEQLVYFAVNCGSRFSPDQWSDITKQLLA
jgi:intracellular multiplication protein IcmJ